MTGLVRGFYPLLPLAIALCAAVGCSSEHSASTAGAGDARPTPVAAVDPAIHAHTAPGDAATDAGGDRTDTLASIQAKLVERINALDVSLDDLRGKVEASASDLAGRIPTARAIEAAIAPRIAALDAGQKNLAEKLAGLEAKLSRPQPAKATPEHKAAPKPKRTRPRVKAPMPPFALEAVETWDGTPQAVLSERGHLVTVYEGETRSGWRVHAIHYPNRITVVHERTGRKRELRCNG